MELKRRKDRAREGFNIVGITEHEITFTHLEELSPGALRKLVDPDWHAPFDRIEMENEDVGDQPIEPSPVMMALESLPPRWRQAIELHLEGITQEKAAEIMGISQPRYFEILRGKDGKLRNLLIAEGYGSEVLGTAGSGTRPL